MKTRVARLTVEKTVREHWFFEVPWHVSHDDVKAYIAEQEFLADICSISRSVVSESEGKVTFVGMPTDSKKAIPLDPDYTRWPPHFTPRAGQMVWWDDPNDGACTGWYQVLSVDDDGRGVIAAPINRPDGCTQIPVSEVSVTGPVPTGLGS